MRNSLFLYVFDTNGTNVFEYERIKRKNLWKYKTETWLQSVLYDNIAF